MNIISILSGGGGFIFRMISLGWLDEDVILDATSAGYAKPSLRRDEALPVDYSSVAEVLSENLPVKMKRIGINDTFGESQNV